MMIKTTVKDNGFEGILLPGDGRKNKVVIVMSGSNGGMKLTKQSAEFYDRMVYQHWHLLYLAQKVHNPF